MVGQDSSRKTRAWSRWLTILALLVGSTTSWVTVGTAGDMGGTPPPGEEGGTVAPLPTRSYYVASSAAELGAYAIADGLIARAQCSTPKMAILDFGNPARDDSKAAYQGYGYWAFDTGDYTNLSQASYLTKQYIQAWWGATQNTSCSLRVVIGTNNTRLCYYSNYIGNHCVINDAGRMWAKLVHDVSKWATDSGIGTRIRVWGGGDWEQRQVNTGDPLYRDWDCYAPTIDFFDGYQAEFSDNPAWGAANRFINFGTASTGACGDWTRTNVWHAAWDGPAYPMPEIYANQPYQDWIFGAGYGIKRLHQTMFVEGVVTECPSFDTNSDGVPDGTAWPSSCVLTSPTRTEWGPYIAWATTWNGLHDTSVFTTPQSSLPFSTAIGYQGQN